MTNKTLAILTQEQIQAAKEDAWDFLLLFIDQYYQFIASNPGDELDEDFNEDQFTLLAFNALYGQVTNGGFLQLILNGYGEDVFESTFTEELKRWGAEQTAQLVEEVKLLYMQHKADLEREVTLEEFSEMYEKYPEFEPFDDQFYEIMDSQTEIVKEYVEKNLHHFASIKG